MVNKSYIFLVLLPFFLLIFSPFNIKAYTFSLGNNNMENNKFIDIGIIIDRYIYHNKTYIILSIVIYNLKDTLLNIRVIRCPYIKILYNNEFILNQTINIYNKSFQLNPLTNITLFNTTILIRENTTLEIFSGTYIATMPSKEENSTFLLSGSTAYIQYRDRIIIGSGLSPSLQSMRNNLRSLFASIPLNESRKLNNNTMQEAHEETNFTDTETMSNLSENNTFKLNITETSGEEHIINDEEKPFINYDLIIAIITTLLIIGAAKIMVHILRKRT